MAGSGAASGGGPHPCSCGVPVARRSAKRSRDELEVLVSAAWTDRGQQAGSLSSARASAMAAGLGARAHASSEASKQQFSGASCGWCSVSCGRQHDSRLAVSPVAGPCRSLGTGDQALPNSSGGRTGDQRTQTRWAGRAAAVAAAAGGGHAVEIESERSHAGAARWTRRWLPCPPAAAPPAAPGRLQPAPTRCHKPQEFCKRVHLPAGAAAAPQAAGTAAAATRSTAAACW